MIKINRIENPYKKHYDLPVKSNQAISNSFWLQSIIRNRIFCCGTIFTSNHGRSLAEI